MKATAIQVKVNKIETLERSVPQVAVATATIKFQLSAKLSFLQDDRLSIAQREEQLSRLLLKALRELDLA